MMNERQNEQDRPVTRKATKKQFEQAMAKWGATLDEEMGLDLYIDLPAGKVWRSNGCHTLVIPCANNHGQSWKQEAYAEAIAAMADGARECEEEFCDTCERYPED